MFETEHYNIPKPVTGSTPMPVVYRNQYAGIVTWTKTSDSTPLSGLFEASTAYTATVTLNPLPGYTVVPDTRQVTAHCQSARAVPAASFSNGGGETGSAIDVITAAKSALFPSLSVQLAGGTETVQFGAGDIGTGLVLNSGEIGNRAALICVESGGKLVLKTGAEITGNYSAFPGNSGVYVNSGGKFTMEGGAISGNDVYVVDGVFTQTGGVGTDSI